MTDLSDASVYVDFANSNGIIWQRIPLDQCHHPLEKRSQMFCWMGNDQGLLEYCGVCKLRTFPTVTNVS